MAFTTFAASSDAVIAADAISVAVTESAASDDPERVWNVGTVLAPVLVKRKPDVSPPTVSNVSPESDLTTT